jgi:hypothetical protein
MRRLCLLGALAAVLAACQDTTNLGLANLLVSPILDSLFVGDNAPARHLIYINDRGDTVAPVGARWTSSQPAVVAADNNTGALTAVGPGVAVVTAQIGTTVGQALVAVAKTLDLQLLLDTIYLMPGDTFTVPVQVKKKGGVAPPAWFKTPANGVFTIDSATGRVTATALGGPLPFFAHADTLVDTGAVTVMSLSDTTGGQTYFTILGSYIARRNVAARGVNYLRRGDTATFRLRAALLSGATTIEAVVLTVRQPVLAASASPFTIDSITPLEAYGRSYGYDPICLPLRNWGVWSRLLSDGNVLGGLSRYGGTISVTQFVQLPSGNGQAISGRYFLVAQRADEYHDPLGALPIRGTFVAPLITDNSRCTS